jgi:hypothetical protein
VCNFPEVPKNRTDPGHWRLGHVSTYCWWFGSLVVWGNRGENSFESRTPEALKATVYLDHRMRGTRG